jgi:hypothetical protein
MRQTCPRLKKCENKNGRGDARICVSASDYVCLRAERFNFGDDAALLREQRTFNLTRFGKQTRIQIVVCILI